MRRWKTRIIRLAAVTVAAAAAATPSATAGATVVSERAGDVPPACAAWARSASLELANVGIYGAQADSYLAQRADNPCHAPITARSLFHAGDPGAV